MKKLIKLIVILMGIYVFLYIDNHWIVTTEHVFESENIPKSFDGLRITQISDLHDASFGDNQGYLVDKVRKTKPDIIVITGDVIDSNRYDLQRSLMAVRKLVDLAEVYYVIGNHEVAINKVDEIYESMRELGVHVLPNESLFLERNGEYIAVVGIEDPLNGLETQTMLNKAMNSVPKDMFTVLLAHRPELFNLYIGNQVDLVFSGHAHGGQFRIPGVGGLIAPGQGFFPKYTAGEYKDGNTSMFVSRGLGNSGVPFRIFNFPEIVVVELQSKQ